MVLLFQMEDLGSKMEDVILKDEEKDGLLKPKYAIGLIREVKNKKT